MQILLLLVTIVLSAVPARAQIPVRGLEWLGQTFAFDGLNCWGTTLYAAGLREFYQYASDHEFTATLDNPSICRRLEVGERVPYGAVGALRQETDTGFEELHGFVVLKEDQILTTKDFTYQTGMQRRSLARDFALFAKASNAFSACGPKLRNGAYTQDSRRCSNWIDFYACQPGQAAIGQVRSPEVLATARGIEKILAELEHHLALGLPFPEGRGLALLEEMSPLMVKAYGLPEGPERKIVTTMYESMAFQFSAIFGEQRTKSVLANQALGPQEIPAGAGDDRRP